MSAAGPDRQSQTGESIVNASVLERDFSAMTVEQLGGYYGGRINIQGAEYALIVAPKALGEHKPVVWNRSDKMLAGALSWNDGIANTKAMAEAGSALAKWALALSIHGHTDYYVGSQDEMEVVYRTLKPTADPNSLWARSGINLSAVPPTWPYTAESPAQTSIALFQAGGVEAFEAEAYWTSTQHAGSTGLAWTQGFNHGSQDRWLKTSKLWARAVRRLAI